MWVDSIVAPSTIPEVFEFSLLIYILLAVMFVITAIIVMFYRRWLMRSTRHKATADACAEKISDRQLPAVSVVVYCRDNAPAMVSLVGQLLKQDYKGDYEIIVVVDGVNDAAVEAISRLSMSTARLRYTYVPDRTHNLSRRKFAITLGLKAAAMPYVLLLDASTRLVSDGWLSAMGQNFAAGYDVVLGASVIVAADGTSTLGTTKIVDKALIDAAWMNAAITGCAYRGNSFNLGYSRKAFFDNNNFAGSLNLIAGDDDIFISKISTPHNTALELSDASRVEIPVSSPLKFYKRQRISHIFTGRSLSKGQRRVAASLSYVMWMSIITTVAVALLTAPWITWIDAVPGAVAIVMLAVQLWVVTSAMRNMLATQGLKAKSWLLVPALLWRPVLTLRLKIMSRHNTHLNYAWATDSRFAKNVARNVL